MGNVLKKLLKNSCNKEKMLLKIWTKKESCAKMYGCSVFGNFLQIDTLDAPGLFSFERGDFIISLSSAGCESDFVGPISVCTREILNLL